MIEFDFRPKTNPFPHQLEAIEFMKGNKSAALFDEQGLGKSKVVIDTICDDIESKLLDGALIVCKKSLIRTWEKEIQTHSNLHYTALIGDKYQRKRMLLTFSHFYIINYESLIQEYEMVSKLLKIRRLALILDESHKIKNPDSIICKTIFDLKEYSNKRIIITGTPVANKPEDLWSQFYFLDNGVLLGTSYSEFKRKYGINISGDKTEINKINLKELQQKINQVSIRRTKDKTSLELPEKIFFDVLIDLKDKQKIMYEKLRDELYIEIENMDGHIVEEEAENILKKLLRLTQIASNPYLIDKSYDEEPSKILKLDELVDKIVDKGEKVIIWSSFVDNINILKNRYTKYKSLKIHGGVKITDRNKAVEWFQNDEDYKVLVANPAAAREGLTLTASNNAVYLDRSFNLVDYLQSQDRIHRISQKKKCNIYKLIAKKTVDEYIDHIMYKKNKIAGFIQGDITDISLDKGKLKKEEIIEMLGAG